MNWLKSLPDLAFLDQKVFQLQAMALDATERYPPVWAAGLAEPVSVLGGASTHGFGCGWITTTPEFSIPGTGGILVITTVFGAWAGLAFVARQRGWRGWRHYVPRILMVIFFIPFGIAGGLPLKLTVLVATLAITQRAVVGLWVLAGLVMLVAVGTDIDIPTIVTVSVPAGAIALTGWKWSIRRWYGAPWLPMVDMWLEQIGRAILLLLAALGLWTATSGIMSDKPVLLGLVAVFFYLLLLYPLFLALRVGLGRKLSVAAREATELESSA